MLKKYKLNKYRGQDQDHAGQVISQVIIEFICFLSGRIFWGQFGDSRDDEVGFLFFWAVEQSNFS